MDFRFKNYKEMMAKFSDEKTCRAYLETMRWKGAPTCPKCGHREAYKLGDGKTYKCKNKVCFKKFTVTVGTVFENTNIPLNTWFAALYVSASHKKGISSIQLSKDLGITQKTAWFMLHRLRKAFASNAPFMLCDVVEADETFVGGKNKNRHAHKKVPQSQGRSFKDKTPVLGLLQRGGSVRTFVVPDTKADTLKPLIQEWVKEGSIIISDEWDSYNSIKDEYNHVVIDHSKGEHARGAFDTNSIEGFWSILKRGIYGIYHQVSRKHLHRYCEEFSHRYNSRKMPDAERFNLSLANIDGRLKYEDLIKK
jgi:transposase-like protein